MLTVLHKAVNNELLKDQTHHNKKHLQNATTSNETENSINVTDNTEE